MFHPAVCQRMVFLDYNLCVEVACKSAVSLFELIVTFNPLYMANLAYLYHLFYSINLPIRSINIDAA